MKRPVGPGKAQAVVRDALKNPFVLVLASAVPIFAYRHPPIMDAPNHLARIWLEAQAPLTGVLGQAYVVDWSRASSNILVDLIGAPLMRVIGLDAVWVVVTLLMVLAAPVAAIFLSRELNGRGNPWQALALSAAWGQSTISGFISYSLALALALGFCLLNLKLARRLGFKTRCLLKSAEVLAIYLTHPFGIGLFFAFEFAMLLGPDVRGIKGLTWRRVLAAFSEYALTIVPTVIYIAANKGNSPLEINPVDYRGFVSHVVSLISPFFAYDGAIELSLFGVIAVCVVVAMLRRAVAFHAGLLGSVVILGILSLIIPDGIGNASLLTRRFPLMAAFLFCIAIRGRTDAPAGRGEHLALVCCLAILAHAAWICHVWREREQDYANLVLASKRIPPGSKVLIVLADETPGRDVAPGQYVHGFFIRSHLPTLLVPLSRSYVPTLFAIPGQQPLVFAKEFQHLQGQVANIPTERELLARTPPYAADRYLDAWECNFDYLLLLKRREQDGARSLPHTRRVLTSDTNELLKTEPPVHCE